MTGRATRKRPVGQSAVRQAALAAVLVVGLGLAPGVAGAADPIRITSPVSVTRTDVDPARLYLAPALAVDPGDPLTVVAGLTEMRTKTCTIARSADGGQTWTVPDSQPALASYPFCLTYNRGAHQGHLAFGRDGTLFYAIPGWDTADVGPRGNASVLVARSTDLGDSWSTVIARDNRGKTGQEMEGVRPIGGIAVDTHSGDADVVHVGYQARYNGTRSPNAIPRSPVILTSRDGGETWSDPVNLAKTIFDDPAARRAAFSTVTTVPDLGSDDDDPPPAGSLAATPDQAANFGGREPILAAGNGTVYAAWASTTANIDDRPPTGIYLSRSQDQGQTWETFEAVPHAYNNGSFVSMAWSPEGGDQGTVHLVYEYRETPTIAGLSDIYHQLSTDGGASWSQPVNVTDDAREGYWGQYFPNVSVAPNGRVDVVWYDTRNDPGFRANDVYYSYSTDNGRTWAPNLRMTDRVVDRRIGVWSLNYDMNSPPSLASSDSLALVGWDDTRATDRQHGDATQLGGGLQDVLVAAAQFEAVGGGTSAATKAVLAGVVGLMAVGIVLLGFVGISRRGSGAPSEVSG